MTSVFPNLNNSNNLLEPKKIKIRNKTIFLYNNNTYEIIIGNLNKVIFIMNYILKYNNSNVYQSDKKKLFENSINDYIKYRNCKNDNTYSQLLRDSKNQILGTVYNINCRVAQTEINDFQNEINTGNNNDNMKSKIYLRKENV